MTWRDRLHLAALIVVLAAIYLSSRPSQDALTVAADARGRVMRLEAEIDFLQRENEGLKSALQTQDQINRIYDKQLGELRARMEALHDVESRVQGSY